MDKAVDSAGLVRDDLEFLIERVSKLADILETEIRQTEKQQNSPGVALESAPNAGAVSSWCNEHESQAERELLRALQAVR